ncbi:hypothetical protein PSAB6_50271 [Paraburkholderia sabiae]|nr:hypothetical protein PSAB6_50271 [Paraburkholderia sabiae]
MGRSRRLTSDRDRATTCRSVRRKMRRWSDCITSGPVIDASLVRKSTPGVCCIRRRPGLGHGRYFALAVSSTGHATTWDYAKVLGGFND